MLTAVSWIGSASGNWTTAADWSDDAVPNSTSGVTINTASPLTVTINSATARSVASLTIGAEDSLAIAGASLVAAGSVSNSGVIAISGVGGSLATGTGLANSGAINVAAGCNLTVGGAYSQTAGATLSLPSSAPNLATDSDFESPTYDPDGSTDPVDWGSWGSANVSPQYAYTGLQSLLMSGPNSGVDEQFAVTPGDAYSMSVEGMTPAGDTLSGDEQGIIQLMFYDASGNQISAYAAPNSIAVLTASTSAGGPFAGSVGSQGWNHFTTTATAPSNAVTAEVFVTTYSASGDGGGEVFWDDLEFGPSVSGPTRFAAASVSNAGVITVGPTNTVTTTGGFAQTSTGTLDVELGGAPTSGNFGVVEATGAATLAGELEAQIVFGYAPSTTDSFTPIGFASSTGAFSNISLPAGVGYQFSSANTFTNVVIAAVPTTGSTATINAGDDLHPATTNLLGVNLAYWDSQLTTSQEASFVTAAGLNVYRFPGGAASDEYHFNDSTNLGDDGANTIPQFAQFISSVAGTGLVTVDYGSGSPQEAAAELAYLQGSPSDTTVIGDGIEWNDTTGQWQTINWGTVGYWASLRAASPLATNDGLNFLRIDHPSPFANIKYWEIGNEEYGSWETDYHGEPGPGGASTGAPHDPATYAAFAQRFASLATEIDGKAGLPAISIGIDSGDPTGESDNDWTQNVLEAGLKIGFVPGFISDHSYMQAPGGESDSFLLNDTVTDTASDLDWSTRYADYESLLDETLSSQASSVMVMATEFNSAYTDPGKQSTSLVNGLFVANSIGSLLDSGYDGAFVWDLRNGWTTEYENNSELLYGWREGGDYGVLGDPGGAAPDSGADVAYPAYDALELASKIVAAGGEVVSASSDYGDLDVYAVKQANGHLDLLVVNANPVASLSDQFSLSGFVAGGSAQVWQYGETQDTAQSQSASGSSALAASSATLNLSGGSFSYAFPAYSMTVLDLPPPPPVCNASSGATSATAGYATRVDPGLTVSDADTSPTLSATVEITGGFQSGDVLSLVAQNGVSGSYNSTTGTLSVAGTFGVTTVAQFQAALASITLTSGTSLATRTVSFAVTDNGLSSGAATKQVSVIAPAEVVGVYVNSVVESGVQNSGWSALFLDYLAANDEGSATYGYSLLTGSGQLTPLPWVNIDQISVAFDEPVTVGSALQANLGLINTSTTLASSSFSGATVGSTYVATWTFAAPLTDNNYLVYLPSSSVTDVNGASLSGNYGVSGSAFTGAGLAGNDFAFQFNVLPADATQGATPNAQTVAILRADTVRIGQSGYSPFYDLTGAGGISALDVSYARTAPYSGSRLPSANPSAPAGAAVALGSLDEQPSDDAAVQPISRIMSQLASPSAAPSAATDSPSAALSLASAPSAPSGSGASARGANSGWMSTPLTTNTTASAIPSKALSADLGAESRAPARSIASGATLGVAAGRAFDSRGTVVAAIDRALADRESLAKLLGK